MKRVAAFTAMLLVTAMLDCGSAHAQARGASAKETLEKGQPIEGRERWVIYKGVLVPYSISREGPEAVQRFIEILEERVSRDGLATVVHSLGNLGTEGRAAVDRFIEESLKPARLPDDVTVVNDVMELQTWLRRLPGRFRIGGRIMMQGTISIPGSPIPVPIVLSDETSGVTDCAAVGEGVGVQCILNANWPVIDVDVAHIGALPSESEGLKTLRPAMLVLGLDLEMPGIWALLVNDESIASSFSGKLKDNTLDTVGMPARDYMGVCGRCLSDMKITAEPGSGIVTIIMIKSIFWNPDVAYLPETDHPYDDPRKVPPAGQLIIALTLHRDPEAQAEVPMKTKKVR